MEMKCLRIICCVTVGDRISNEIIRRRVGVKVQQRRYVILYPVIWVGVESDNFNFMT